MLQDNLECKNGEHREDTCTKNCKREKSKGKESDDVGREAQGVDDEGQREEALDEDKVGHVEEVQFEEGEGKEEQLKYGSNSKGRGLWVVAEKVKLMVAVSFGHKCMLSNIMTVVVKRYTSLLSSVFVGLFFSVMNS